MLWFPNRAVDSPSAHDMHLAEISELTGNLTEAGQPLITITDGP